MQRTTYTEQHFLNGICSASNCQWPIAAWCIECRAKVCHDHLQEHRNLHARDRWRATHGEATRRCFDCGEPLPDDEYVLHRYEDGTVAWYCLNDTQCAARVFQQRGGKIRERVMQP